DPDLALIRDGCPVFADKVISRDVVPRRRGILRSIIVFIPLLRLIFFSLLFKEFEFRIVILIPGLLGIPGLRLLVILSLRHLHRLTCLLRLNESSGHLRKVSLLCFALLLLLFSRSFLLLIIFFRFHAVLIQYRMVV